MCVHECRVNVTKNDLTWLAVLALVLIVVVVVLVVQVDAAVVQGIHSTYIFIQIFARTLIPFSKMLTECTEAHRIL